MGSKSKSRKTTTNQSTSVNSTFDGENAYQLVNSSNNEITFTDHGAVKEAFDAFDTATGTVQGALSAVRLNTDKSIAALKEFATQLTVGDIEGSKWIAMAIIVAVVVVAGLYFWLGK
jgi:hypothetical protein